MTAINLSPSERLLTDRITELAIAEHDAREAFFDLEDNDPEAAPALARIDAIEAERTDLVVQLHMERANFVRLDSDISGAYYSTEDGTIHAYRIGEDWIIAYFEPGRDIPYQTRRHTLETFLMAI